MAKEPIGEVIHFFDKISVAIIKLSGDLKKGDKIAFEGKNSFEQTVDSMQIEHEPIEEAKAGQEFGLKVDQEVKEKDKVFKVTE